MKQKSSWRRRVAYVLAGLAVFALTLPPRPGVQLIVCALALGFAVWQLSQRQFRLWWTGAMCAAVGLYVVGLYLAITFASLWLLYFGCWILVIVTLVAEGGRSFEARRAARLG